MIPIFCCGFECGVSTAHGGSLAGTSAFSTTTVRSGTRSLRCNPTAGVGFVSWSFGSSPNIIVYRAYVQFASLPTGNAQIATTGATNRPGAYFKASDSKIYAGYNIASLTTGASGVSVTTGQWYRLDVKVDLSANPWLIDVQVDGTACGQASNAVAAASAGDMALGIVGTNNTADMFFDDWVISLTSGDYPIGAGHVDHFVTTSDGTHNIAGTGDFQRGNTGTDILNSTTDAYLLVDDVPLPSGTVDNADCWRGVLPANPTTDYVESVFGPAPGISTPTAAPRAVEVVLAHHQIATQNGQMVVRLNDNGTTNDVFDTGVAAGVTTYRYARKHYATPPTGGSWTVTSGAGNFNNIRTRFLAPDAAPDQCLDGIMIEAEFSSGPTVVEADGSSSGTSPVTGVSGATAKVDISSTGLGTVTGAGVALTLSTGSATGVAVNDGQSAVVRASDAASVGVATDAVVGASVFTTIASSTGLATSSSIASATALTVASSSGVATENVAGNAIGASLYNSTGLAVVSGVGENAASGTIVEADAASSGVAVTTGVGFSINQTVAASDGIGTASGIGASFNLAVASSDGVGTGTGLASALALSDAASTGAATVLGDGQDAAGGIIEADASASGSATSSGVSSATAGTLGASAGVATTTGVSGQTVNVEISAAGIGTVTGISSQTNAVVGASAGIATVLGESLLPSPTIAEPMFGAATVPSIAESLGVSTALIADLIATAGIGAATFTVLIEAAGTATGIIADAITHARGTALVASSLQASSVGAGTLSEPPLSAGLVASL